MCFEILIFCLGILEWRSRCYSSVFWRPGLDVCCVDCFGGLFGVFVLWTVLWACFGGLVRAHGERVGFPSAFGYLLFGLVQ